MLEWLLALACFSGETFLKKPPDFFLMPFLHIIILGKLEYFVLMR